MGCFCIMRVLNRFLTGGRIEKTQDFGIMKLGMKNHRNRTNSRKKRNPCIVLSAQSL